VDSADTQNLTRRFEQAVLPHLDAAYNLARWLCADGHDAEDVVQEAYLRAFRAFGNFRGEETRCWLLTIVRNTCYTWLTKNRSRMHELTPELDSPKVISDAFDPQAPLIREAEVQLVHTALEDLPPEYREVIVLRELEELSYKQISQIAAVPIGTVMSRLSRARQRLESAILAHAGEEEA
jgi:RNA polymerase sigma-70 factor (ECF subfamily)